MFVIQIGVWPVISKRQFKVTYKNHHHISVIGIYGPPSEKVGYRDIVFQSKWSSPVIVSNSHIILNTLNQIEKKREIKEKKHEFHKTHKNYEINRSEPRGFPGDSPPGILPRGNPLVNNFTLWKYLLTPKISDGEKWNWKMSRKIFMFNGNIDVWCQD